jgi:hypothetical protein
VRKLLMAIAMIVCLVAAEKKAFPFEGSYTLNCKNLSTGEEYSEEVTIWYSGEYRKYNDYYGLQRHFPPSNYSSEDGILMNNMLITSRPSSAAPISVFKIEGSELYALMVTGEGEVTVKMTNGECPLELNPLDTVLAGKYAVEGVADDFSFMYLDTLILEPEGKIWSVSRLDHHPDYLDRPGSIEPAGFGFSIGNTIVFTYYLDGKEFLKVFETGVDTLKSRWVVYYWDTRINGAVVTVGSETLTPIPDVPD